MKKAPLFLLMTAAIFLCCCICFFVIRNIGSSVVRISALPAVTAEPSIAEPAVETIPMATSELVDINTADLELLMTLPGIGATYAQRIIDYREEHGPFTTIEELLNVPGIGTKRLETIAEFIIIGGSHENTGC